MLWALTTYFNPQGYSRRRANYRAFRAALSVPLLTVELAIDGRAELSSNDAERLVRLPAGDVLWQKERLLNVGLQSLPDACDAVLCADCDVLFLNEDWPVRVSAALEHGPVVQAFSRVVHADERYKAGDDLAAHTVFVQDALAARPDPASDFAGLTRRRAGTPSVGHAWAFRRDILDTLGLFDSCVIGGGDSAIACAAFGAPDAAIALHGMTAPQVRRYRAWAAPFSDAVGGRVTAATGSIAHLWHGRMTDRQPQSRHAVLVRHEFDPYTDVRVNAHGAWEWCSDKPALHLELKAYFAGRREDARA